MEEWFCRYRKKESALNDLIANIKIGNITSDHYDCVEIHTGIYQYTYISDTRDIISSDRVGILDYKNYHQVGDSFQLEIENVGR